jgi:choline dehydrogenase-like flavoprotein
MHRDGQVTGVKGLRGQQVVEYRAPLVILAAGGMGTAPILNRSGIWKAGRGIFIDPLVFVGGAYQGKKSFAGTCYNAQMSVGSWEFHDAEGFMLTPLVDPWMIFIAQMAMVSLPKVLRVLRYRKWMSIMVKIKDDMDGQIFPSGNFSKPLTEADRQKLNRGYEVSKEILVKAGCNPKSVVRGPVRGAHPGGACRIGEVVDANLQTEIQNLYVSDASVFPRALGTPVVATVMALNKRLARHLLKKRGES